jgi:hypothetical protein
MPVSTIREQIAEMSADKSGVSCSDIKERLGISSVAANSHLYEMTQLKRLFRGQRPGVRLRWFKTEALRDAWQLGVARGDTTFTVVPIQVGHFNGGPKKSNASRSHEDASSTRAQPLPCSEVLATAKKAKKVAALRDGEVDYSKAKFTKCEAPKSYYKFQCDPALPPLPDAPGFATQKYGNYDRPASTWAAAAASARAQG